jgi:hypothetical protein
MIVGLETDPAYRLDEMARDPQEEKEETLKYFRLLAVTTGAMVLVLIVPFSGFTIGYALTLSAVFIGLALGGFY